MRLCFPVAKNEGLESPVFNHFGSAPLFLLVDTQTQQIAELPNRHHTHGACGLPRLLAMEQIDALVSSGIGQGALIKLSSAGIDVYRAEGATIADNMLCLADKRLRKIEMEAACAGHHHGSGHSCGH